jgi:hypothetical protein
MTKARHSARVILMIFLIWPVCLFAQEKNLSAWGVKTDYGFSFLGMRLAIANLSGGANLGFRAYGLGLVKFNHRGFPDFSFGYSRSSLALTTKSQNNLDEKSYIFEFRGVSNGFVASKYITPFRWGKLGLGLAIGFGAGALDFDYRQITEKGVEENYKYGAGRVFVPLLDGLLRSEVSNRHFGLSFLAGLKNSAPFTGAEFIYHF